MRNEKIVHTTSIGRAWHAQLAPGIGAQHIGHQLAIEYEGFCISGQAIAIEARAAQAAGQQRLFIETQPLREQTLTERTFEKGCLAIQVASGNRREEMTEQSSRQFGCKQHRDLARWYRTGAQSADSTLGGALADKYAVFQIFATATDVIPVIALHLAVCLSNHHA